MKKSHYIEEYIVKVVVVCVQASTVPLKALKQTQNHSLKLKPLTTAVDGKIPSSASLIGVCQVLTYFIDSSYAKVSIITAVIGKYGAMKLCCVMHNTTLNT